jgi:hypothetical protein
MIETLDQLNKELISCLGQLLMNDTEACNHYHTIENDEDYEEEYKTQFWFVASFAMKAARQNDNNDKWIDFFDEEKMNRINPLLVIQMIHYIHTELNTGNNDFEDDDEDNVARVELGEFLFGSQTNYVNGIRGLLHKYMHEYIGNLAWTMELTDLPLRKFRIVHEIMDYFDNHTEYIDSTLK